MPNYYKIYTCLPDEKYKESLFYERRAHKNCKTNPILIRNARNEPNWDLKTSKFTIAKTLARPGFGSKLGSFDSFDGKPSFIEGATAPWGQGAPCHSSGLPRCSSFVPTPMQNSVPKQRGCRTPSVDSPVPERSGISLRSFGAYTPAWTNLMLLRSRPDMVRWHYAV